MNCRRIIFRLRSGEGCRARHTARPDTGSAGQENRGFFLLAFDKDGNQSCGGHGGDEELGNAFFRAYRSDAQIRSTLRPIFMSLMIGEMAQVKEKNEEQALGMLLDSTSDIRS